MRTRWNVTNTKKQTYDETTKNKETDALKTRLCEYNGIESVLPTGYTCLIPDWKPEFAIVKRWKVANPKIDEGSEWKTYEELKRNDFIIAAEINLRTLNAIFETYKRDEFIKLTDANGRRLTCNQWEERYHTDPLGLLALRNIRAEINKRN